MRRDAMRWDACERTGRDALLSCACRFDFPSQAKGRHDPCVLPRTPPLVEGMAALVLADAALIQRTRLGGSETCVSDARTNFVPHANGHAQNGKRPREA
jgi:hypothetical protein